MSIMPNYLEYDFLFESYTVDDLELAWKALHDPELEQELYETNSMLLHFMVDTQLQEMLALYIEDARAYEIYKKEADVWPA